MKFSTEVRRQSSVVWNGREPANTGNVSRANNEMIWKQLTLFIAKWSVERCFVKCGKYAVEWFDHDELQRSAWS